MKNDLQVISERLTFVRYVLGCYANVAKLIDEKFRSHPFVKSPNSCDSGVFQMTFDTTQFFRFFVFTKT